MKSVLTFINSPIWKKLKKRKKKRIEREGTKDWKWEAEGHKNWNVDRR